MVSAASFGQSLTASEVEVDQAFKTLRGENKALFRLIGAEYFGSTTTPINVDLFYDRPVGKTMQDLRMELLEARNGAWTRRVVADGRHVWGVDLVKNTYSTARYGSYNATKPADYEQNGFQSLNVLSNGQSSWLSRLTREVWGGNDAVYRPWIPASSNRSEATVQGTGATFADPVVPTRIYASSLTKKYHVYWLSKAGTPVRSLTFELVENASGTAWNLNAIYFSDRTAVGSVAKLTDWKADLFVGTALPAAGNFAYTPSPGARAIAGPRPNGSG